MPTELPSCPAVAVALDAIMVIEGKQGQREVAAPDFFLGDLTTAIEPHEFLREIRRLVADGQSFSRFSEVSVRKEGVAVVGLAVHTRQDGEKVKKAAFVAMGVDAAPVGLRAAEAALLKGGLTANCIEETAKIAAAEIDPAADLYASAAYRSV